MKKSRALAALLLLFVAGLDAEEPSKKIPPAASPDFSGNGNTLGVGLESLSLLTDSETRSVSPENPTGEKGQGGMAIPIPGNATDTNSLTDRLGQGWKSHPFSQLKPGETKTILDAAGPGIIQHVWLVADSSQWRAGVLRFYWDDETTPSVETPLGDFFAVGHGIFAPVNSTPVLVNPGSALNCFWPMPFRRHARITLTNEGKINCGLLTYQITYAKTAVPPAAAYFHAQYRQASTRDQNPYIILDGVKGRGKYVGTFLAWRQKSAGWFGEGEVKFFFDGDREFPTICGTGTEDYFLSSYGFEKTFSTPFVGLTLRDQLPNKPGDEGTNWSMYRWHVLDPISFQKDLRVTIQALGWDGPAIVKKYDDISSVAFWYQEEPHHPFSRLPSVDERLAMDEAARPKFRIPGAIEAEELLDTATVTGGLLIATFLSDGNWSNGSTISWAYAKVGDEMNLELPCPTGGDVPLTARLMFGPGQAIVQFSTDGGKPLGRAVNCQAVESKPVDVFLGTVTRSMGRLSLHVTVIGKNPDSRGTGVGIDAFLLSAPSPQSP